MVATATSGDEAVQDWALSGRVGPGLLGNPYIEQVHRYYLGRIQTYDLTVSVISILDSYIRAEKALFEHKAQQAFNGGHLPRLPEKS